MSLQSIQLAKFICLNFIQACRVVFLTEKENPHATPLTRTFRIIVPHRITRLSMPPNVLVCIQVLSQVFDDIQTDAADKGNSPPEFSGVPPIPDSAVMAPQAFMRTDTLITGLSHEFV